MEKLRMKATGWLPKGMRYLCHCILLLLLAAAASAQEWNDRVSVNWSNATLREVCNDLESKSGIRFSYSEQNLSLYEKKITLSLQNAPLKKVLDTIFHLSPLSYTVKGKLVLLIPASANNKTQTAPRGNGMGAISGTITDASSGELLSSATVKVGRYSTTTNNAGSFLLSVPAGSYQAVITSVGFDSKRQDDVLVSPGQETVLKLSLSRSDKELDQVVVTALGISKEKKKLGYAVQEVKGEEINVAKSTNMLAALQGKVAGMNLTQASSGIANSVRIVLRGESSLNINKNQALLVVDGMPINNNNSTAASSDLPVDYGSGGAEINPNDIESISVLKGPNAAALYGSRAANGVIIIKTKKAGASRSLGVTVNSSVVFDRVLKLPEFQNEYGGGTGVGLTYYSYGDGPDGPNTANSGHNWGAPFEGQSFVQYGSPTDESGKKARIPWVAHPDNVKDFYVTGKTFNTTVSVEKAGDIGRFRASYGHFAQTGIMPNTELNRHLLNVNSSINITPRLSFNANVNYINAYSDNLPVVGYGSGSPTYNFIWFERNADINWFKDYWEKGKEGIKQKYYFTWGDNPYLTMYEHLNGLKRNRIFGNVFLNYAISDKWDLMVRTGIDYSGDIRMSRRPIGSVVALNGLVRRQDYTYFERNSDFLVTYKGGQFLRHFHWSASAGGNNLQINTYNNITNANGIVIPNVYNLGNASSRPAITETNTLKSVNSLYAFADIDYKNQVFLQITARNDWSSTLPKSNNSYFYPSVSLSAIASDIFQLNANWLNYWKVRASFASVGNDTEPYQTEPYYSFSDLPGSVTLPGTLPNADLKPEITTSYEAGTEIKFLNNRVGLDFSYYFTESRNQILVSPLAPSTAYTGQVLNAGKIQNQGFEIAMQFVPVQGTFNWNISFTGSRNTSKIVELAPGVNSYIMATGQNATIEARVGGKMGDIYGIGFLRNDEGKIIYKDGVPVFSSKTLRIGNYNPDFIAGVRNSFRYKSFGLSVLFDGRFGGTIYSYSHSAGSEAGSLATTLPGRKDGIVGDGVVANSDGTYSPNTQRVAAYTYYRGYYKRPNVEANSFDATYFKLREVILSYTLPANWIARTPFKGVQLNITGRNLLLFARAPGIDPETAFVSGATILPGIENAQIPSTRSMGIDVRINF